jgi:hypothetical protein
VSLGFTSGSGCGTVAAAAAAGIAKLRHAKIANDPMERSKNCSAIVAVCKCECGWGYYNYKIGMEEREELLNQAHE